MALNNLFRINFPYGIAINDIAELLEQLHDLGTLLECLEKKQPRTSSMPKEENRHIRCYILNNPIKTATG